MTFGQVTFARRVLGEMAKEAGLLGAAGGVARGVGRGANWAWQKSMKQNGPVMGTIGLGLGAAGAYALGRHAVNQTRAAYQGFDPNVQAYTRQSPY